MVTNDSELRRIKSSSGTQRNLSVPSVLEEKVFEFDGISSIDLIAAESNKRGNKLNA